MSQLYTHVKSTDLAIYRSANVVVMIVVFTVFEVLFPVLVSICDHVIVAKLLNVPPVAVTVPVIVTVPPHPLNKLEMFNVNTVHEILPVDIINHVNHEGRASEITTPVAVAGHAFA